MNRFEELRALLESLADDFEQFYERGNKAAGTRLRKALQELKRQAQEIRRDVLDVRAGSRGGGRSGGASRSRDPNTADGGGSGGAGPPPPGFGEDDTPDY